MMHRGRWKHRGRNVDVSLGQELTKKTHALSSLTCLSLSYQECPQKKFLFNSVAFPFILPTLYCERGNLYKKKNRWNSHFLHYLLHAYPVFPSLFFLALPNWKYQSEWAIFCHRLASPSHSTGTNLSSIVGSIILPNYSIALFASNLFKTNQMYCYRYVWREYTFSISKFHFSSLSSSTETLVSPLDFCWCPSQFLKVHTWVGSLSAILNVYFRISQETHAMQLYVDSLLW